MLTLPENSLQISPSLQFSLTLFIYASCFIYVSNQKLNRFKCWLASRLKGPTFCLGVSGVHNQCPQKCTTWELILIKLEQASRIIFYNTIKPNVMLNYFFTFNKETGEETSSERYTFSAFFAFHPTVATLSFSSFITSYKDSNYFK